MQQRLRGGMEEADIDMVEIDMATISDEDILNEFLKRDFARLLPTIPDPDSPKVQIRSSIHINVCWTSGQLVA